MPGRIVRGALLGGLVGGWRYQALRISAITNVLPAWLLIFVPQRNAPPDQFVPAMTHELLEHGTLFVTPH